MRDAEALWVSASLCIRVDHSRAVLASRASKASHGTILCPLPHLASPQAFHSPDVDYPAPNKTAEPPKELRCCT